MRPDIKIATCSYCGKRSTLQLSARDGHELACGSCGAPIHEMKPMKTSHGRRPHDVKRSPKKGYNGHGRRQKKRKPFWREMIEEVIDEIFD